MLGRSMLVRFEVRFERPDRLGVRALLLLEHLDVPDKCPQPSYANRVYSLVSGESLFLVTLLLTQLFLSRDLFYSSITLLIN